ncbi:hypothetical protein HK097_009669 [Rhizophlyctis rosea]|uniref:Uncharacterized protein n=1 Tax=Rhizophlyctis rosea TaxID=64517 RepID=A0AAD5X452_9FUNG|nr:hypothetical protein HK097_009669 [Rhizophlyctis rosea]
MYLLRLTRPLQAFKPLPTLTLRFVSRSAFLNDFYKNPTMPGPVYTSIQEKLSAALEPTQLEIVDDSAKHAGHAAMKGLAKGETHFRVVVVSNAFEGKPQIKRHQLIYQILDEELKAQVHALSLTTKTPAEFEKLKA